ncbi:methionine/alanine import family NSS transporter small subunit [Ruania halotolerans]|uniref:methionine/alanine import family NSS transporter small subunit n=1 Tax=Ruania halotolerans TaxID=2897773 RepID=UPI001E6583E8|nr:methionine/alanine import family NSS transporter small subunit [Ruania halotolerans]UFU07630.1 methionine/alanine import family NSS transporter small subunit [Ruania halotolerans]
MDPSAVIMMIIALGLVWGALAASLVHLRKHPEEPDTYDVDGDGKPDTPPST